MNFFELNEKIFFFINKNLANPFLDFLVLYIFIPFFPLLILIPFWLFFKKKNLSGIYSLFLGFFLYWLGHSILKPFFGILRPFKLLKGVRILGPFHPSPYSFPSTTTMLVFGLVLPIFLRNKKLGSFLLVLAFLVSFSLIYGGYHTPLDVLAGVLFSLFFVLFFEKILKMRK